MLELFFRNITCTRTRELPFWIVFPLQVGPEFAPPASVTPACSYNPGAKGRVVVDMGKSLGHLAELVSTGKQTHYTCA